MVELLEHASVAVILQHFEDKGLSPAVHTTPPPAPTAEERRRMSRVERRAWEQPPEPYWVDLSPRVRWYGSGSTEEAAIRSAAKRWRIEQIGTDNERKPGEPLP